MYAVHYAPEAQEDAQKLTPAMAKRARQLIDILKKNPFQNPPPYEKLHGNLNGFYSRRLNIKHRLVYAVLKKEKIVRILSMWSHYGE